MRQIISSMSPRLWHKQFLRGHELSGPADDQRSSARISKGWAISYVITRDGKRQVSAIHIPGDLLSIDRREDRSQGSGMQALTDVSVDEEQGDASDYRRERAILISWLVNLGRRNASTRIAHLFCEIHLRLENSGAEPGLCFDFPLGQEQLSDAVGLTPVHTNRVLRLLREHGLMEMTRRSIQIFDLQGLRKWAAFDGNYLSHALAS